MKKTYLLYSILYTGFILLNVIVVAMATVMIFVNNQEMAGAILLFLEAMIFLSLKQEVDTTQQDYMSIA